MKLTMLGTGNAMVTNCYNTCFAFEEDGRCFLVDAGGGNTILRRLREAGIDWKQTRDIFVTHKHIDHILGIVWMMRIFCQNMKRGSCNGEARIYAHREVVEILQNLAATLLQKNQADYIRLQTLPERKAGNEAAFQAETCLRLIIVEDGEMTQILGHPVTFFDIHSTKAKQFGFTLEFAPKRRLTCCGDEPYNEAEYPYAKGSEWLLHEAFCLYEQADVFHPYEKHHSTAKDAALLAEQLGVKHLLLYHTEDKNLARRRELYTAEARQQFQGEVHVPEDLESYELV